MKRNRKGKIIFLILMLAVTVSAASCGDRTLLKRISGAIAIAYRMPITTDDQPWKLVRGIHAFGLRYLVVDSVTQEKTQALVHLAGPSVVGLVQVDDFGPYFAEKAGQREGEIQRDMFSAIVAREGATKETGFLDDFGSFYSMDSFIRRSMDKLDVTDLTAVDEPLPGRESNQVGWSLVMLGYANLSTARWTNYKGIITSSEDIMEVALARPLSWGTDQGFIEQIGIATLLRQYKMHRLEEEMAQYRAELKRYEKKEIPSPALDNIQLEGVWAEAQAHVDKVLEILKANQVSDGSFSKNWHSENKRADDANERVLYTGYALDYLSVALPEKRIDEEWVQKTATTLCAVIKRNRFQLYEETWTLSEAAHALRLYRERLLKKGQPFVVEPEFESDDKSPVWTNKEDRKRFFGFE